MKNKVDRLLDSLQGQQPTLERADELTESILARLPEAREPECLTASNWGLRLVRTVSTVAAAWVIGFCVYEGEDLARGVRPQEAAFDATCLLPPSSTLQNAYEGYREKKHQTLDYVQLKRRIYENK